MDLEAIKNAEAQVANVQAGARRRPTRSCKPLSGPSWQLNGPSKSPSEALK